MEAHSASKYEGGKCTCEICREASRLRMAKKRQARYRLTAENGGVAPIENHGASTYTNWGCRCPTCLSDHNIRVRDYKRRRRQELLTEAINDIMGPDEAKADVRESP